VVVTVTVREATATVSLNAAELTLSAAAVRPAHVDGAVWVAATAVDLEPALERAHVRLPTPLAPGTYHLRVVFAGTLNDQMAGFYRSTYTAADGSARTMAVTQFEATDARKAFPCWDEPACKAVFAVTLVVPRDRVALSNMPVAHSEPDEDGQRTRVSFAPTPIMSTYLVAFVVGELEHIEAWTTTGVQVRRIPTCTQAHTYIQRHTQRDTRAYTYTCMHSGSPCHVRMEIHASMCLCLTVPLFVGLFIVSLGGSRWDGRLMGRGGCVDMCTMCVCMCVCVCAGGCVGRRRCACMRRRA
jgi:hypothetical protein